MSTFFGILLKVWKVKFLKFLFCLQSFWQALLQRISFSILKWVCKYQKYIKSSSKVYFWKLQKNPYQSVVCGLESDSNSQFQNILKVHACQVFLNFWKKFRCESLSKFCQGFVKSMYRMTKLRTKLSFRNFILWKFQNFRKSRVL